MFKKKPLRQVVYFWQKIVFYQKTSETVSVLKQRSNNIYELIDYALASVVEVAPRTEQDNSSRKKQRTTRAIEIDTLTASPKVERQFSKNIRDQEYLRTKPARVATHTFSLFYEESKPRNELQRTKLTERFRELQENPNPKESEKSKSEVFRKSKSK